MKHKFIQENRSSFPVLKMCQAFKISPSGFYRWLKVPLSPRKIKSLRIRRRIAELYQEHMEMAGSPMITADLRAEREFSSVKSRLQVRFNNLYKITCLISKLS
jgi:putative transposase